MKEIIKSFIFFILSPVFKRFGRKNSIYLTFDDGPHPVNTPKIVEILDSHNIKATFFMTGTEMEKYPDVVQLVIESGHHIGYHSYNHVSMKKLRFKDIIEDLAKGKSIAKNNNYIISLYRPPYGDLTFFGFFWLIFSGWTVILWSKDSRDSFDGEEQVKINVSSESLNKGEILLFHDDYPLTVSLLPSVLSDYTNNGVNASLFN